MATLKIRVSWYEDQETLESYVILSDREIEERMFLLTEQLNNLNEMLQYGGSGEDGFVSETGEDTPKLSPQDYEAAEDDKRRLEQMIESANISFEALRGLRDKATTYTYEMRRPTLGEWEEALQECEVLDTENWIVITNNSKLRALLFPKLIVADKEDYIPPPMPVIKHLWSRLVRVMTPDQSRIFFLSASASTGSQKPVETPTG